MKTGSRLAVMLFVLVALAHLLRLVFQINVSLNDWAVPQWISLFGVVVPGFIAWLIWKEHR